jgi:hypothetical protein
MHSKDHLAAELHGAGLHAMADKASTGYYHDYLSPLDFPEMQLVNDLMLAGTDAALALRRRAMAGEFDATSQESDEWADSPEGKAAFRMLRRL